MKSYITVKKEGAFEYEDRKSVFIGKAKPVSSEAEALEFIASVKKEYPDARHHVYAYVLRENQTMRFSDDHEPQGTAGMPVLDAIRKRGCTDVAIVVTRYFGGTLLGTGGLVHAYSASAVGALNDAEIVVFDIYSEMQIECSYSDYQKISPALSELSFREDETVYGENVLIRGSILKVKSAALIDNLIQITSARAKAEILTEKYGI